VRIELTIEVLQTSALPLGYRARYHVLTKSPRGDGAARNWSTTRTNFEPFSPATGIPAPTALYQSEGLAVNSVTSPWAGCPLSPVLTL
jgi:hypothetical protein